MQLRTVRQIVDMYPAFTESAIRWLLYNRVSSGLIDAVVKIGRKVLIDQEAFEKWLSTKKEKEKQNGN